MHQSHALVELGPQFRDYVETRWHEIHAKGRLVAMGLICGGVLSVLLALFGYFNVRHGHARLLHGPLEVCHGSSDTGSSCRRLMLARSIPWLWI